MKKNMKTILLLCLVLFACVSCRNAETSSQENVAVSPLACRFASYMSYRDAAWEHLPQLGVTYVFLRVPPPEKVAEVKARLAAHGLKALVMGGGADLSTPAGVDQLAVQLAACEAMDVHYLFLSPKGHGASPEVIYKHLKMAGDIAKKHDVIISLETHPDLGTNGDVHLATMKAVDHPNVRVNFDTANIHYYNKGRDAVAELKKIIDYVATVEVKDHDGGYHSWYFPALGKGVIDISGVLKLLKEHNYHGPVTIEIEGIKGVKRSEAEVKSDIAESVKYLRGLGEFK